MQNFEAFYNMFTLIYIFYTCIYYIFIGQYGVPKPWYFFLTKTYWCNKAEKNSLFSDIEAPVDHSKL